MNAASAQSRGPERGTSLLIAHCESLDAREPAAARLAVLIGDELAHRLVTALAGSHPPRSAQLGS